MKQLRNTCFWDFSLLSRKKQTLDQERESEGGERRRLRNGEDADVKYKARRCHCYRTVLCRIGVRLDDNGR